MQKLLVFTLALAACDTDEPPAALCTQFCDDGDSCTDDRCDPSTGECVFVPRDVANACRRDDHCDDGVACTIDTCEVDEQCGFQRCRFDASHCEECFSLEDCEDDGNFCTTEICRAGFCGHEPSPLCDDRTCDPNAPIDGATRLSGEVQPKDDCCACATDATIDGTVIDGTCHITCPGGVPAPICTPIAAGPTWNVVVSGDDLDWCLAPSELSKTQNWTLDIRIDGQPAMTCVGESFATDDPTLAQLMVSQCLCNGCGVVPDQTTNNFHVGAFVVDGQSFFSDPFFGLRRMIWKLFPTRTGFAATLESTDDLGVSPIRGTLTMRLQGLGP